MEKLNGVRKLVHKAYYMLLSLVNILTYIVICVGACKSFYYTFKLPNWDVLLKTIVVTLFAIHINLKNPGGEFYG